MSTPRLYTLVERCCGSAALTFFRLGARRAVVPYQGSKWRVRRPLGKLLDTLGFEGPPARVVLTDPGPWGIAVRVLLDLPRGGRAAVADLLDGMAKQDVRELYDSLLGAAAAPDPIQFTAEFLFLQRLAHSGKACGLSLDGGWRSPGFNRSSAYGLPGTDKFGPIKPMIPALVAVLRGYDKTLLALPADDVLTAKAPASLAGEDLPGRVVEYLDPPYKDSTGYPNGHLGRGNVIDLARAARHRGAAVLVSESTALPELVQEGWTAMTLREGASSGDSPFKSKDSEWVTYIGSPTC